MSWVVGQTDKHPPIVTLRGSAGIFYERFAPGNILTSIRQNGTSQQAFLIEDPNFYPNIPSAPPAQRHRAHPYGISPHHGCSRATIRYEPDAETSGFDALRDAHAPGDTADSPLM